MVFSSLVFLFLFLPIVLSAYLVIPPWGKNGLLLVASLFFYAWGEGFFVLVMVASILFNYLCGLGLGAWDRPGPRRTILGLAVTGNLGMLGTYKYANFLVANLNDLLTPMGWTPIDWTPIHLPIGISFFTFQALSYVVDVYRHETSIQRNPFHLALYISLFPQLIAGPIVRYHDIAKQLTQRTHSLENFAVGIRRFTIGLGKKVIIANTVARTADAVFNLPVGELTPGLAWLGLVCYTLQIYFDFSGYSDMAIGLGHMFGFHFLENFKYPYISRSVREFWRRWHISLSTWFRDYLYIPLGGSRGGSLRTGFNLLLVFFLCGLWHGASWTFVAWGLFHGFFLALERGVLGKILDRLPSALRLAYTLLVAMIGWVFFRSASFEQAAGFLGVLAGFSSGPGLLHNFAFYWDTELAWMLLIGIVGSTPVLPWLAPRLEGLLENREGGPQAVRVGAVWMGELAALSGILIYSAMLLASQTHNPFLYFRF